MAVHCSVIITRNNCSLLDVPNEPKNKTNLNQIKFFKWRFVAIQTLLNNALAVICVFHNPSQISRLAVFSHQLYLYLKRVRSYHLNLGLLDLTSEDFGDFHWSVACEKQMPCTRFTTTNSFRSRGLSRGADPRDQFWPIITMQQFLLD